MTGHDDFDRTLADWFEADALSPAPVGDLDRVIDATRHRTPRPSWLSGLGSDWVEEAPDLASSSGVRSRPSLGVRWSHPLIVLLAIAALVGGAILIGARLLQSSPLPTGRLGHLAFGLDDGIYLADWDGRNPARITATPPDGSNDCYAFGGEGPMWSPDGRHLAYRSGGAFCPGATVLISDPTGQHVVSVPGTGWLVSWSPDSTRVATWVDLGKTIGIYGVDGVRQALLTMTSGCALPGDFDPVWSFDGTSLVIAGCVVPLDGRTPRRAPAHDPRSNFTNVYSRDGSRSAYIGYSDNSASLVVAGADGTVLRVLAGAPSGSSGYGPGAAYQDPILSRTGDRVAFVWSPAFYDEASDPSSIVNETFEVRVVDVASGTVTTLASATGGEHLGVTAFSPEGDRLLFSRSDVNYAGTSLWSARTDGSEAQPLVTGTGWGDWQWLPPGS
jgi:WD40-like Beta Propeller Repeat